LARAINERINGSIESTCAVGVDEMSWDDLNYANITWPTVQALRDYRNSTRQVVDGLIATLPMTLPITWDSHWWIILMGIEHERIHLETSSVLFRQLPPHRMNPSAHLGMWRLCPNRRTDFASVPANVLIPVPSATVTLEKEKNVHPMYGWDLEFGVPSSQLVQGFSASKFLVSNMEFFEFVASGAYNNPDCWTKEGWAFVKWRSANHGPHPVFWVRVPFDQESKDSKDSKYVVDGFSFRYRALGEVIDMPWDWPVDVNYLEAKAFCIWKSQQSGRCIRLPTEAEWNLLRDYAYPQRSPDQDDQPFWESAPGNVNLEYFASSTPIDAFMFSHGFGDIVGNVWQHTETPVNAFKGFQTHRFYDDFSVPTFDCQHNIIKGGSWISTGNEATRHARYAFRRHFYQHAGFRYIESNVTVPEFVAKNILCEKERPIAGAIHAHWGPTFAAVPNYQKILAAMCIRTFETERPGLAQRQLCDADTKRDVIERTYELQRTDRDLSNTHGLRALDLGCGPGRATFELATFFDSCVGLDITTKYARVGACLREGAAVQYAMPLEGELETFHTVDLKAFGLDHVAQRTDFLQADVNNLDPKYSQYDFILASNILEFLYDPALFLSSVHERLRPHGVLCVCSKYEWDVNFTPREKWLSGFKQGGESVFGLDGLEQCLSGRFRRLGTPVDLASMINVGASRWDYATSQVTFWQLNS